MAEEILTIAGVVTGAAEEEQEYLLALCRAEQTALTRRLKEPLAEQDADAFVCPAACLVAADYYSGKGAGGAVSWKAGEVSVQEQDAAAYRAAAESLRTAARQLAAPLVEDGGFAFWGVKG